MAKTAISWIKIYGARAIHLATGRIPSPGTWRMTWGDSKRFAADRWHRRDAGFERREFSYDDAVQFLTASGRGAARDIREGSIPKAGLATIVAHLETLKPARPLRGLHIGDFVGVSLACLTDAARRLHPESVVMSIDPNIPHRGIESPRDLVTGLMTRYGLTGNWVPVTGFTLERTAVFDILNRRGGATEHASFYGFSAIQVLRNLARLGGRFDFVLIDGNHSGGYLRREIEQLSRLVRPGGLLFLDDVDENWEGVTQVFENLDAARFRRVAHDNRVGVVQMMRPAQAKGAKPAAKPGGGKRKGPGGKRPGGRRPGVAQGKRIGT